MFRAAFISLSAGILCFGAAFAQQASPAMQAVEYSPPALSALEVERQERCLTTMSGFPNDDATVRYQFFKLVEMMASDATPNFLAALDHFGEGQVSADAPLQEVVDGMANPVIRQALPSLTVAQFYYLFDFADGCRSFIEGQLGSLIAYDEDLTDFEFNKVIAEDSLFLRQILMDALFRLKADEHSTFGPAVQREAVSLVQTRDRIEYAAFESSISEVEAVFMGDLDGRLAKVNDLINSEMDREILSSSIELAKDMSEDARQATSVSVWRVLCPFGCEFTF